MLRTCLLIGFLCFLFLPARAGHTPPKVTLRVHVQTTGEGQSPQEAMSIQLPPRGETIQIRTLPETSEVELISAVQDASGVVHLQFNHAGQVSLSAATAQNQGRILVVFIDGYVVYSPIIDEQISNGELDIPTPIKPDVLLLLQERARENVKEANKT
jgi:hypothetical protein